MVKYPDSSPSREELQQQLRTLKVRVAGQDDELRRLREAIQGLSAQIGRLPETIGEERQGPVPAASTTPASAVQPVPNLTRLPETIDEESQRPVPAEGEAPAGAVGPVPKPDAGLSPAESLRVQEERPVPVLDPASAEAKRGTGQEERGSLGSDPPAIPVQIAVPRANEAADEGGANETKPAIGRGVALETRIGTYWFNRIGLVLVVISFALFSRYIHSMLQPWHKIIILYLGSGVLFGVGKIWEGKLQQFARPVMAGGLALSFLTSYAAHFVPATACFSLLAALVAMLLSVVAMLICAERWQSETTAGLAILFGHAAILVAGRDTGSFTTIALLALGSTAVVLGIRHEWMRLNLCTVLATFATHTVWAIRPSGISGSPEGEFWLHFLSATAYYAIFTGSALTFQKRRADGMGTGVRSQVSCGRTIGPGVLILYVSFIAWLFRSTGMYPDTIQWFLFSLALVQLVLARVYRHFRSLDAQVYLAAATVFSTLALFAWLDGLTLNLALAAEALLLLILSRSLDLWLLNPLAQVVLLINFVHFWGSDARVISSWSGYLGAVASASVYFVKARLEETWRAPDPDRRADWALPVWVERLRPVVEGLVQPLSHLHALAGGILLAYQCHAFFGPIGEPIALAGFILLISALIGRVHSVPWGWGSGVLHLALVLQMIRGTSFPSPSETSPVLLWITYQGASVCVLTAGVALVFLSCRGQVLLLHMVGLLGLMISPVMVYYASSAGEVSTPLAYLCLLAPLAYWCIADRLPGIPDGLVEPSKNAEFSRLVDFALRLKPLPINGGFAIVAGILTNVVARENLPGPIFVRWFLVAAGLAILATVLLRGRPALAAGLVVLLALNVASLFNRSGFIQAAELPAMLIWALVFCSVLSASWLVSCGVAQRRSSFVASSLLILGVGMASTFLLLIDAWFVFFPRVLWLLTGAGFWVVIEVYNRGLPRCLGGERPWQDEMLLHAITQQRTHLATSYSLIGALLVSGVLYQGCESLSSFWRAELVLAVAYAVGTAVLRSPSLAVAGATVLIVASGGHLLCGDSLSHPFWTGCLLLTCLAAGATAEWLSRRAPADWPALARKALAFGAWYGALSTLGMGAIFLNAWAVEQFSSPSLAFACQLLAALPVALVGVRFALPVTACSTSTLVMWVTTMTLVTGGMDVGFRPLLHVSAILIAVQTIALERMLSHFDGDLPQGSGRILALRKVYVVAGAVLLLFACHWAVEIRDAWTTLGWSITALIYLGLGFFLRFSIYRRVALAIFLASIVRIIVIDMAGLAPLYRIVAFLALGACLIGASFLYSRYRDEIQKWL